MIFVEGKVSMPRTIPETFPTTIVDRFLRAFYTGKGDIMVQLEMHFDCSLDKEILRTAFALALDAEPILGCRFAVQKDSVVWQRLDRRALRENFMVLSNENDYCAYRNRSLDAAGLKTAAYCVASLYRRLRADPVYQPAPNVEGRRSIRQITERIPRHAYLQIVFNAVKEILHLNLSRPTCGPFAAQVDTTLREYSTVTIDEKQVARCKEFGKSHGATINDLFLCAFLRSIHRNSDNNNAMLRCSITVDMRRWYLDRDSAASIANLSFGEIMEFGKKLGAGFNETLARVSALTRKRKHNWFGITLHAGLHYLCRSWSFEKIKIYFEQQYKKDIHDRAVFPMFTNMGTVDKALLAFDVPPKAAAIIGPADYPPFFGIGMSGYDGTLTLAAAGYPETKDKVQKILEDMIAELPV